LSIQGTANLLRASWMSGRRYTFPVDDPYEKEVRRLAGLIGSLVELSGRPLETVAAEAGLNPDELAGIFRGAEKLEVAHLLRLAEALGVHPGELFYLARPRRVPSKSSTRELLERAQEILKPRSEAADSTPDGPENRGRAGEGPASPPAGGRPRGGRGRP
jgi:transcriptional regulator with XRE-family HTH domain